jgi:hypothetical protein
MQKFIHAYGTHATTSRDGKVHNIGLQNTSDISRFTGTTW